jgi:hypothetical protein
MFLLCSSGGVPWPTIPNPRQRSIFAWTDGPRMGRASSTTSAEAMTSCALSSSTRHLGDDGRGSALRCGRAHALFIAPGGMTTLNRERSAEFTTSAVQFEVAWVQ